MVTADPARTPTFTPFAQGDYFLNASRRRRAPAPTTTCRTASSCRTRRRRTRRSPGTTAASSPRSHDLGRARRPGRRRRSRPDQALVRPHGHPADDARAGRAARTTYVTDGRVMTEFLKADAVPKSLEKHTSDGRGARRGLQADHGVLRPVLDGHAHARRPARSRATPRATPSTPTPRTRSPPSAHSATRSPARSGSRCGAPSSATRRSTRSRPKAGSSRRTSSSTGRPRWPRSSSSDREPEGARQDQAHRRDLRGEPQLRQPVRRLGRRQRPGQCRRGAHHPGQPGRQRRTRCLKQNDVNLNSPTRSPATCSDSTAGNAGGPFASHFTNAPFTIDTYIPPTAKTCPPTRSSLRARRNGMPERPERACPAAAPGTSSTASTRSSTSSTVARRTATSPAAMRSA